MDIEQKWEEFIHDGTELMKNRPKVDSVCITGYYDIEIPPLDCPESLDDALDAIEGFERFCRETFPSLDLKRTESPKFMYPRVPAFHYSSFIYSDNPIGNILSARFNVYHPTIEEFRQQGLDQVADYLPHGFPEDQPLHAFLKGEFIFPLGEFADSAKRAVKKVYDDLDCISLMNTPAGYQPVPELVLLQDGKMKCAGFEVLGQMGLICAMKPLSFEYGYLKITPPPQS